MLGGWLCVCGLAVHAGPLVSTSSPIGFFTNVASRLLQSDLNLSLNRIQLWPTNQYTPSVHRLLQVTANLYDATTNRTDTGYPHLPSVFYPLFTNDNGVIYINGYAEATDTSFVNFLMCDLQIPQGRAAIGPGTMAYGVPAIIGAKKGFPNFNEFAMQTQVQVVRKLQFRRPAGSPILPVNQTNQMFVVSISNVFGVEAWNSYATNYPRDLRLVVLPDIKVTVTNEVGTVLVNSRFAPMPTVTNIAGGTWSAYNPAEEHDSFQIPVFTNLVVLTNAVYSRAQDAFVPLTGVFEPASPAFYIPHWWLNLRTRLRVALIDTSVTPMRVVDYVNLDAMEPTLDLTTSLMSGGTCGDNANPVYTSDASDASMWCTNHHPSMANETMPTYGILNQFLASVGMSQPNWNNSLIEFPLGLNKAGAIDFFRVQFDLAPLTYPGVFFQKTNVFKAPFQPTRNIYLFTTWQANDPLVHHTVSDLTDLSRTNTFDFSAYNSTLVNLGLVNRRYEPWGWYGGRGSSPTKVALSVKDPLVGRSDYWDFPTGGLPDLTWLGRVHRGTPWQTIYLKAPGTSLTTWQKWTGNGQVVPDRSGGPFMVADAFFTQPTNDWRLASLLISLLSTNDPRTLASVNQPGVPAWRGLLDGLTALTNAGFEQLDPLIMSSNSPQAATIAGALDALRSAQPNRTFRSIGDILAAPQLSTASPWLNLNFDPQALWSGPTDAAYEAIPSQLLPLLRPDSTGAVSQSGGTLQVQFTGADGYAYTVQTSSNLLNWTAVSTNYPANGSFNFVDPLPPGSPRRFYRSILRP